VILILVGVIAFQTGRTRPGSGKDGPQANTAANPPSNPVDVWSVARVDAEDLPPGWKFTSSRESESRGDVLEGAGWWGLQDKAEQIEAWRRADLAGPNEAWMRVFLYRVGSTPALDACLKVLNQKWLPQQHIVCFEKETTLVLISSDKTGRVLPAQEALEDRLRQKLKLKPAVRNDPSVVLDGDFPIAAVTWTGADQEFTQKLPNLRDGWEKLFKYGEGKALSMHARGYRFFETEDAKKFALAERVKEPAEDEERRVIHAYERVVVLTLLAPAEQRGEGIRVLEDVARAVAKRTRGDVDPGTPAAELLEFKLDAKALALKVAFKNVTARELRRLPEWKIDAWSAFRDGFERTIKAPEITIHGEARHTTLTFPIDRDLKLFFQSHPRWMTVRMFWNGEKDEVKVDVDLEGKLPPELDSAFGRAILTEKDMPAGWKQRDDRHQNERPQVAVSDAEKNRILAIFDPVLKVERKAVDIAYADAIEPEEKLTGFDSARFYLLKFNDAQAQAALVEKLKDHAPGMADDFKVHSSGDTVFAAFFYGSNADAMRAFEKVREVIKKKLDSKE